jgi:hypothetical protein
MKYVVTALQAAAGTGQIIKGIGSPETVEYLVFYVFLEVAKELP